MTLTGPRIGQGTTHPARYRCLVVPVFQRPYVWPRDRVERLFDDLVMGMEETAVWTDAVPRFLGSLLLCGTFGGTPQDPVDVIDGQQRLITLTMLAACLRDRCAAAAALSGWIGTEDQPTLQLRPAEAAWFREHVVRPKGTERKLKLSDVAEGSSEWNLTQNREYLRKGVNGLSVDEREKLVEYLRRCRVVVLHVDDHDDAYQIFLSINEGGVPLTEEDVFQAELLGPLDEHQQREYRPIIEQIAKYRREKVTKVGSRGKTFFSHLAHAQGWRSGLVRATRKAIRDCGGPEPFVREMFAPHADVYLMFTVGAVPASLPEDIRDLLEGLSLFIRQVNDDALATVMVLWTRYGPTSDQFRSGLRALDRFAHGLGILGLGGARRRTRFGSVNAALRDGRFDDALARMELSKAEQMTIRTNLATALHTNDHSMSRVVLVRIDAYRSGRPVSDHRRVSHAEGDDRLTVEHVLPQGPTLTADARKAWASFPRDDERQILAQYLGNLTLTTHVQNQELGQRAFVEKLPLITRTPFASLVADFVGVSDWTENHIAARHEALMDAVLAMWGWEGPYPRLRPK